MSKLINNALMRSGVARAYVIKRDDARVYIPGMVNNNIMSNGTLDESVYAEIKDCLPKVIFSSKAVEQMVGNEPTPCLVAFESGNNDKPIVLGFFGKGVKNSANVVSTYTPVDTPPPDTEFGEVPLGTYTKVILSSKMTSSEFENADIKQIPFLSEAQIYEILEKSYFGTYSNSRLNVQDKTTLAKQLYNVQTLTNLSVLVSFAICAQETGWARSFAGSKYNFWNFGANSSRGEFGHYFDNAAGIAPAFKIFHDEFLKQYYDVGNSTVKKNGGPWKSLKEMASTYCSADWSSAVSGCAVTILKFVSF